MTLLFTAYKVTLLGIWIVE